MGDDCVRREQRPDARYVEQVQLPKREPWPSANLGQVPLLYLPRVKRIEVVDANDFVALTHQCFTQM